jgi:hypothetical protein
MSEGIPVFLHLASSSGCFKAQVIFLFSVPSSFLLQENKKKISFQPRQDAVRLPAWAIRAGHPAYRIALQLYILDTIGP